MVKKSKKQKFQVRKSWKLFQEFRNQIEFLHIVKHEFEITNDSNTTKYFFAYPLLQKLLNIINYKYHNNIIVYFRFTIILKSILKNFSSTFCKYIFDNKLFQIYIYGYMLYYYMLYYPQYTYI